MQRAAVELQLGTTGIESIICLSHPFGDIVGSEPLQRPFRVRHAISIVCDHLLSTCFGQFDNLKVNDS
jgi:hypothetical protein